MTPSLEDKIRLHRALPTPSLRRALRKANGLTQDDLAMALGCDRVTIARYELGKRTPRGERLVRYVELLQTLRSAP